MVLCHRPPAAYPRPPDVLDELCGWECDGHFLDFNVPHVVWTIRCLPGEGRLFSLDYHAIGHPPAYSEIHEDISIPGLNPPYRTRIRADNPALELERSTERDSGRDICHLAFLYLLPRKAAVSVAGGPAQTRFTEDITVASILTM